MDGGAQMRPEPRPIALSHVATAEVEIGPPIEVGDVPTGRRRIFPITGGSFRGPLLNATIHEGGADWQVVTGDGTALIDTRYSAETDSGAVAFVATQGFRRGPPEVLARVAAGDDVDPAEYYFRLTARLESSDPELEWVNRTVFVATAERFRSAVRYDLYAIE